MRLTAARQGLEVAKIENDAATFQADADKNVLAMSNEAQARVFEEQVRTFGTGVNLARHVFYERLGPTIQTILSSDRPDGPGGLFLPFVPQRKEVKQ